jgi:phosphatidylinositol alpha-1,6-mannosyltransferase
VAPGQSVIQAQLQRGYGCRPYREIPSGIDLDRFRPDLLARARIRHALGWEDEEIPVVGFVGRFVPEKGLTLLMATLDRLKSPWRALFVGGGPMRPQLTAFCDRHGPARTRVLTGVNHDAVADYLNALDLLCLPSQTTPRWREQYGRVIVEAFACGVPVVASDSGGISDAIGDAGIMIPEHDADAWLATLEDLLSQPARREELSRRGLERAREHCGWPAIARRHLEFFEELVKR